MSPFKREITNMSPNFAIRVDKLGVEFFLSGRRKREFWALRDVSFEVAPGEIFGVIGGNGAGKSTLLKVIAGIYPATAGTVEARGAVAPLIELGGAVNPELTGAENIFLVGSIYRVPRREVRRSFDEIVEFAGLRRFIDTPVKNYSSGMFIRLAFSTIIFFRPDIVLIDEVFSVGDEVFQQKSFEKILGFKERGATIVIVSHDLNLMEQVCGRAMVLSRGRAAFVGPVGEAVGKYRELVREGEVLDAEGREEGRGAAETAGRETAGGKADLKRWGNRKVEIRGVEFVDEAGRAKRTFAPGERFEARIPYRSALGAGERPVFGVAINTAYRMLIYGPNTLEAGWPAGRAIPGEGVVKFVIPELPLFPGEYLFSAAVYDPALQVAYDHHNMLYSFKVASSPGMPATREFGLVKIRSLWAIE
jgi:ABC-type polysaccharide/polyol phosphate transport system ATPase subunit